MSPSGFGIHCHVRPVCHGSFLFSPVNLSVIPFCVKKKFGESSRLFRPEQPYARRATVTRSEPDCWLDPLCDFYLSFSPLSTNASLLIKRAAVPPIFVGASDDENGRPRESNVIEMHEHAGEF